MDQVKLNMKYRLLSLQTGKYLTRDEDKVSIVGSKFTGKRGQEWVFQSTGDESHFTIKAVDGHGVHYLTIPMSQAVKEQKLQCGLIPTIWKVCQVKNMATVARFTPMLNENLNIDVNLKDVNSENGTKIQLWPHTGKYNQLWVLEEVNK